MHFESEEVKAVPLLEDGSDEWKIVSARIAWILWLTEYRAANGATGRETELAAWAAVAPEYRSYVRRALRSLQKEGIKFGKTGL